MTDTTDTIVTKDLVERASANANLSLTKKGWGIAIDEIFEVIKQCLDEGFNVKLNGIGIIKLVEKEARNGRNPRTGETVSIPAKTSLKLSVSKTMKEMLNR
jgi:DNA-binding protein HU-beta